LLNEVKEIFGDFTWPNWPGSQCGYQEGERVLREIERDTVIDPPAGSKRGRKVIEVYQLIFFGQPGGEPRLQGK